MCYVFPTMSSRFYAISNRTGRMCNKNHISVKSKGLALFLCLFLADYSSGPFQAGPQSSGAGSNTVGSVSYTHLGKVTQTVGSERRTGKRRHGSFAPDEWDGRRRRTPEH